MAGGRKEQSNLMILRSAGTSGGPLLAMFAGHQGYEGLGMVSLLAGIDLATGQVHALVKDRHRGLL